jgi:hypothetical protein
MSDKKGHLGHQAFHDKKLEEGAYREQKAGLTKESAEKTLPKKGKSKKK